MTITHSFLASAIAEALNAVLDTHLVNSESDREFDQRVDREALATAYRLIV
jgi:hypothetical protein